MHAVKLMIIKDELLIIEQMKKRKQMTADYSSYVYPPVDEEKHHLESRRDN